MIVIHEYNSKESRQFVNEAFERGQNPTVYTLDELQREFPAQQVYMTIRAYPTTLCIYDAYWDPTLPNYDPNWVPPTDRELEDGEGPTIISYGRNVPAGVINLELGMEFDIEGQHITIKDYGDCLKYEEFAVLRAYNNPPHEEQETETTEQTTESKQQVN